jgi:hypothetical protein
MISVIVLDSSLLNIFVPVWVLTWWLDTEGNHSVCAGLGMVVGAIVYVYVDPQFCKNEDNFWFWCLQVKVKVKFTLEQATKAQRGNRGITLLLP